MEAKELEHQGYPGLHSKLQSQPGIHESCLKNLPSLVVDFIVCIPVCVHWVLVPQKSEVSDPLQWLQAFVSHLTWMLDLEFWSSARIVSDLNHWTRHLGVDFREGCCLYWSLDNSKGGVIKSNSKFWVLYTQHIDIRISVWFILSNSCILCLNGSIP